MQKLLDSSMTVAIVINVIAVILLVAKTGIKFNDLVIPLAIWAGINIIEDIWVAIKVSRGGKKLTFFKGTNFALDVIAIVLIAAGAALWSTMASSNVMCWIIWALAGVFTFNGIIVLVEYWIMD